MVIALFVHLSYLIKFKWLEMFLIWNLSIKYKKKNVKVYSLQKPLWLKSLLFEVTEGALDTC